MLRGVSNISLWADDVEAAKEWYAELLGVEPYFRRPDDGGPVGYYEFRIGDHLTEVGIVDRRYAPPGASVTPGGVVLHWHVDDVQATLDRLLSLGAKPYMPVTERGEGFVTAAVIDPFGNVLGFMYNPHYLEVLSR